MSKQAEIEELASFYEDYVDEAYQRIYIGGARGGADEDVKIEELNNQQEPEVPASRQEKPAEDLLVLRSGNTYPRSGTPSPLPPSSPNIPAPPPLPPALPKPTPALPTSRSMSTPGTNTGPLGQSTAVGAQTLPQISGPIRVVPSDAGVREFTYEDDDYTARDFIELCENVMTHVGTTGDVDKIAFVRARVKQGSEASKNMRVSAIITPTESGDYETFKKHFLRVFGENVEYKLPKGVHLAVERILEGVNSMGITTAQRDAHKVSADLTRYLQNNKWGTNTDLSWKRFTQFLEFFTYMLLLQGKYRKGAQELKYAPGEILLDFADRLKAKKDEAQGESSLIAPVVEASRVTPGIAALSLEHTSSTGTAAPKLAVVCSHCRKTGHTEKRCYARKHELKKTQRQGGAGGGHGSGSPQQPSYPERKQSQGDFTRRPPQRSYAKSARPQSPRERGSSGANAYCIVHEAYGHPTADCYTLERVRKELRGNRRVGGSSSSGEGARPKKYDPT